jgi:hypothetical protein
VNPANVAQACSGAAAAGYEVRAAHRSPGRPSGPAASADPTDEPNAVRGFVNGALIAVPLWSVIGLLIWSFLG